MTTSHPQAHVADTLLSNGRIATIRTLVVDDRASLLTLFAEASDENIRFRFFSVNRQAGEHYLSHLFAAAPADVVALVAEVDQVVVALGTAEIGPSGAAEVSFLVADAAHGLGLGTLLLEHLAAAARGRGVQRFTADVISDNNVMLKVFRDAGLDVHRRTSSGVTTLEMGTAATARAISAADDRECVAEAQSLLPLLYPGSVAVVGASKDPRGIGRAVLTNIRAGGYTGGLFVVHPTASRIDGVEAFPRLEDIPGHVDLVLIAVPASGVPDVVQSAADAGVSACVILSSGFSELGGIGLLVQRDMVATARRRSMRVVGPNCMGIICNDDTISLNATFATASPPVGGLAFGSQSGGVGIELLGLAAETGLGLATFVSLGNKADVSGNDLLAAWMTDPRVTAAALYLESFGNAPKFARLARKFAERKPLLAVVGGRSSGGKRAGASHTAAAATPNVGIDAMFAQSGVIGCSSITMLTDTARLLTEQPLPAGPRLGVIGNVGGLGVLAADAATAAGLLVPKFSDGLAGQIAAHVAGTVGHSNPVDLGADCRPADFEACLNTLLVSDEVDSVLAVIAVTAVTDSAPMFSALARSAATCPTKPVLLIAIGDPALGFDVAPGATRFRSVEGAADALARAATYSAWLTAPRGSPAVFAPEAARTALEVSKRSLDRCADLGTAWMDVVDVRRMLTSYGIEAPVGRIVQTASAAVAAAEQIGFPVVAKVADSSVVHKTERRLVRTGLRSGEEVRTAITGFLTEMRTDQVRVVLQPDLGTHLEIAVGVIRDPGFGPMVMVAAGGVAVNVMQDQVFLLPPVTELDAARAVRSLRIWPLLDGYRGMERVDVESLEQLIVAVAQLAVDVPAIAELDLNPVIVTARGAMCVDAKIRLVESSSPINAGVPRSLRSLG
ncbi:MAG: GCN5-related N-acetyltransferase [Marmoricola sp.]|nr:GCN5-related N-acetyltransferase [Marmoricola sp.]